MGITEAFWRAESVIIPKVNLRIYQAHSSSTFPQTLTLARDYAHKVKKPFPEIDSKILEEKDWPKDCYVFQGEQDQPTIIYMPLFNRKNCKGSMLCKYKAMGNTSIIISTDLVRERRALILY